MYWQTIKFSIHAIWIALTYPFWVAWKALRFQELVLMIMALPLFMTIGKTLIYTVIWLKSFL